MGIELNKKNKSINLSGELLRGEPGGYYIPTVDADGNLTWEATTDKMPDVAAANIKGEPGKDGITPFGAMIPLVQVKDIQEYFKACENTPLGEYAYIINVGKSGIPTSAGTLQVGEIIEIEGTGRADSINHAYIVYQSTSGFPSTNKYLYCVDSGDGNISFSVLSDGAAGKDGISPTLTVSEIEGGNRISFVSYGNVGSFDIMDGKDGQPGKNGSDGQPGKNGSDGISVSKVEVDSNNHLQVSFSNGQKQDAGEITVSGGSGGSAGYELIKSFEVKEGDDVSGLAFGADDNGKPFSLRAICAYCYFPAASGAGTLEIGVKNTGGALKGIYKRSDVLATSAKWVKLDMELKGYWTGGSAINTGANGVVAEYVGHARNTVSNPAYYINIASNVVLPVGTTIEVYGVRS